MKRTTILVMSVLTVALALAGANSAQTSEPQTGENGDCADYNLLYLVNGVDSPLAPVVQVQAGTGFTLVGSSGTAHIDFRDVDGNDAGYVSSGSGTVPAEAAYGIVCVGVTGGYPEIPVPGATWAYVDGL
jgi:opacity protein-like surface antigen